MAANMVLGQPNFTAQNTTVNQSTVSYATQIAIGPGGQMAVAEAFIGRVMIWNSLPNSNGQAANVVVGKPDFLSTSHAPGTTQFDMSYCTGIAFSPLGKLLASDVTNNRVLIWNSTPTSNYQPADVVIGQNDFVSNSPGVGPGMLNFPAAIYVDAVGRLFIPDYLNNRVLIYNTVPTLNNPFPDVVVGQSDFNSNASGSNMNQLFHPYSVSVTAEGKMVIGDVGNGRVLIYNQVPNTNGVSADIVLNLSEAFGIAASPNGNLVVTCNGCVFNQVQIFNSTPIVDNQPSDIALGTADWFLGPSSTNIEDVYGVVFEPNGMLWVAGWGMHRAMRFGNCSNLPTITANGPTTFCGGNSVQLTSSSSFGNSWNFGGNTQNVIVTGSGNYYVTVRSCFSNTIPVTVIPLPDTPDLTRNQPLFDGGPLTLTATANNAATYHWTGPNGFVSMLQNPTIPALTTADTGFYFVHAENSLGCVGPTDSIQIVFSPEMNGAFTVGTGGDFETLTEAIDAFNDAMQTGPVIFELTDDEFSSTTENFPIVIFQNPGSSETNTLTIRPADGVDVNITGNVNGPLIDLNGADNVIIEGGIAVGRPGLNSFGPGSMTIRNNSISGNLSMDISAIRFIYDACNNVVQNCTLRSAHRSYNTGTILFGRGSVTGNDSNIIANCHLDTAGGNYPMCHLYSGIGSNPVQPGIENDSNYISNNNFINFYSASSSKCLALRIRSAIKWEITGNSFYQTGSRTYSGYPINTIYILGGDFIFNDNFIGGTEPQCGGSPWECTGSVQMEWINLTSDPDFPASSIQNNTVKNISITTSSTIAWPTTVFNLFGNFNFGTIAGNIIGDTSSTESIKYITTGTSTSFEFRGIYLDFNIVYSDSVLTTISNNIIAGIAISNTTTGSVKFYGIYTYDTEAITNNKIGSILTENNIQNSTNNVSVGIRAGLAPHHITTQVSDNVISNITANNTGSTTQAIGIENYPQDASPFGIVTVTDNFINKLTTASSKTGTGSSASVIGISCNVNGIIYNIDGNSIDSLSNSNTGSVLGVVACGTRHPLYSATVTNNTLTNFNGNGGTSQVLGIFSPSAGSFSGGATTMSGNIIKSLETGSISNDTGASASVIGISSTSTFNNQVISGNTISTLSNKNTGNVDVSCYGVYFAGPTTGTNLIEKNFIHSLRLSSTSSAASIKGININTGAATLINNMIRLGVDADGASVSGGYNVEAILKASAGNSNIYHNSIYIGGTGVSATANTYGFRRAVTGVDEFKNNIVVNNRSNGSGTGKHYCMSIDATTTFTSTNNIYQNTGTGAVFGIVGTTDRATLTNWQTATGKDNSSAVKDPGFINPNGTESNLDLHISSPSPCESNGKLIASVIDDFDDELRDSLTPVDIGADAGDFEFVDITAPIITYTLLANPCGSSDVNLSGVTITDSIGIAVSGAFVPRIYYRKNAGTFYSQPGVLTSGNGKSGTWDFPIVMADMGGVQPTDVISYFVIAQDSATNPNIKSNPSGVIATDVNTVTTPPTQRTFIIYGPFDGIHKVGIGMEFTTLTSAIARYNAACLTGPITFLLTDASYVSETFPITINANSSSSSTNTLLIRPDTGVTVSIKGTSSTSMIKLFGADYVIIDGSNNDSTDRSLTITNIATTNFSASIWVSSLGSGAGASNNTIKNCILSCGSNILNTFTIYSAGSTISTTGSGADNDNLIIQNNQLGRSLYGIYVSGTSTQKSDNLLIISNTIGSSVMTDRINQYGIRVLQADNFNISENEIFEIGNITPNGSLNPTAIVLTTGANNGNVTRNFIHDIIYTGTSGYGGKGIDINGASNILLSNNIVNNVLGDGKNTLYADAIVGIRINAAPPGYIRIYHNTINLTGSISRPAATSDVSAALFINAMGTSTLLDVRNNIFCNSLVNTTGTATAYSVHSNALSANFSSINYNNYFVSGPEGVLGYINGVRTTLASWQAGTLQDVSSENVSPVFASATNLHLVPGSNPDLDGGGFFISDVAVDFDGELRSISTPDIGADEFDSDLPGINIRVLLEGYCLSGNLMIPVIDPVNHPAVCDTIIVELRDTINPFILVYSDTDTIDVNGYGNFEFPIGSLNQYYYLVVRHRNSIETWSASPVLISGNNTYDFTTAQSQAYGSNMIDVGSLFSEQPTWAFYSGDISDANNLGLGVGYQDGVTDGQDYSDMETAVYYIYSGYTVEDITGDGVVSGDDYGLMETNVYYIVSVLRP